MDSISRVGIEQCSFCQIRMLCSVGCKAVNNLKCIEWLALTWLLKGCKLSEIFCTSRANVQSAGRT